MRLVSGIIDLREVEMRRLIILIALVALVTILAELSASDASDTGAALADNNVPNNHLTTSQTQAGNSSASGTITITMYAVADE